MKRRMFRHTWSTKVVRAHLQSDVSLTPILIESLVGELPDAWQKLVYEHGYAPVFECLRRNLTLGGTQYELRSKPALGVV